LIIGIGIFVKDSFSSSPMQSQQLSISFHPGAGFFPQQEIRELEVRDLAVPEFQGKKFQFRRMQAYGF